MSPGLWIDLPIRVFFPCCGQSRRFDLPPKTPLLRVLGPTKVGATTASGPQTVNLGEARGQTHGLMCLEGLTLQIQPHIPGPSCRGALSGSLGR